MGDLGAPGQGVFRKSSPSTEEIPYDVTKNPRAYSRLSGPSSHGWGAIFMPTLAYDILQTGQSQPSHASYFFSPGPYTYSLSRASTTDAHRHATLQDTGFRYRVIYVPVFIFGKYRFREAGLPGPAGRRVGAIE